MIQFGILFRVHVGLRGLSQQETQRRADLGAVVGSSLGPMMHRQKKYHEPKACISIKTVMLSKLGCERLFCVACVKRQSYAISAQLPAFIMRTVDTYTGGARVRILMVRADSFKLAQQKTVVSSPGANQTTS